MFAWPNFAHINYSHPRHDAISYGDEDKCMFSIGEFLDHWDANIRYPALLRISQEPSDVYPDGRWHIHVVYQLLSGTIGRTRGNLFTINGIRPNCTPLAEPVRPGSLREHKSRGIEPFATALKYLTKSGCWFDYSPRVFIEGVSKSSCPCYLGYVARGPRDWRGLDSEGLEGPGRMCSACVKADLDATAKRRREAQRGELERFRAGNAGSVSRSVQEEAKTEEKKDQVP